MKILTYGPKIRYVCDVVELNKGIGKNIHVITMMDHFAKKAFATELKIFNRFEIEKFLR